MSDPTANSAERYLRTVRAVRASVVCQTPPPPPYAHDTAHYSQIAAGERERRLRAERRARGWRTAALYSTAIALGIHGTKALALWAIGVALALVVLAVWLNVTETEEQR